MIVSYNWLKEYVDFELTPAELAEKMTDLGLEANIVSQFPDFFQSIVVGHVESVEKHPNADKLSVCEINIGGEGAETIVCGAPNIAAGQNVPVATVGTVFPGGHKIKKAKLRGVASNGMVCSERELELSDEHSGIMVLDSEAVPGTAINDYLSGGDFAIEIDLTPNRPDALGHMGVARDIAAALGRRLEIPPVKVEQADEPTADHIKIQIDDADGCPRYAARIVRGVKIGPSPAWLQQRLQAVGQRPINNVVDAANYILMDTGHPLHTFDMRYIEDNTIIVRRARTGEKMTTLDGKERELDDKMLLICDGQRPVALAGIMGGENSEVKDDTTDILIEGAYFDPVTVRRGSKLLQLPTEAAHRFERGADPDNAPYSVDRLAILIKDLAGGEILSGLVDANPGDIQPLEVSFRPSRCNMVLGTDIPASDMQPILENLGFDISAVDAEAWQVTVPTWRPDVTREIDLVEEVGRVYGYDNIPIPKRYTVSSKIQKKTPDVQREKVIDHLTARGFLQAYAISLVSEDRHPALFGDEKPVFLSNPLSQEMTTVRSSLLPGLETIVAYNLNRKQNDLRICEIGQVCHVDEQSDTGALETTRVAIVLTGREHEKHWLRDEESTGIYHLKGHLRELFDSVIGTDVLFRSTEHDLFENGVEIVIEERVIGYLGELSDQRLKAEGIKVDVAYAEFVLENLETPAARYQDIAVFPSVERDMSILVDKSASYDDLQEVIEKNGGKYLILSRLYDLYEGKGIAPDKKSLTFRLVFQNPERTLTEKEVDRDFQRVVRGLEDTYKAKLREA